MIGSIRRPRAQNPRISKKIRGFQIIAESSGGFAKSVRHQWITRPYRSRGHRSDRRRETFLLIPIVYRVNHAGNSGSHCKENRAAERITKHGNDKEFVLHKYFGRPVFRHFVKPDHRRVSDSLQHITVYHSYDHSFPLRCKAQKGMKKPAPQHSIKNCVLKYAWGNRYTTEYVEVSGHSVC